MFLKNRNIISKIKRSKVTDDAALNKLFFKKKYETRYISTLVNSMDPDQLTSLDNSVDPDQLASEEASWSGSTVFNARCELIIIYQNMKYRIVLTLYIVLVQGQVYRNFRLVQNEMGPGWTSRAWYFHSPVSNHLGSILYSWIFCDGGLWKKYHNLLSLALTSCNVLSLPLRKPVFG